MKKSSFFDILIIDDLFPQFNVGFSSLGPVPSLPCRISCSLPLIHFFFGLTFARPEGARERRRRWRAQSSARWRRRWRWNLFSAFLLFTFFFVCVSWGLKKERNTSQAKTSQSANKKTAARYTRSCSFIIISFFIILIISLSSSSFSSSSWLGRGR